MTRERGSGARPRELAVALLLAAAAFVAAPGRAAAYKQAALIHLDAGPKVKPAEVEPLERALADDIAALGFGVVWAEPAVTNLAIGVDPKKCLDVPCRQKLAQALDAKLVAGGKVDRRKDPVLGNVVDLGVWLLDPAKGQMLGEDVQHCAKCSAADVEAAWLRALRAAEEAAGLVEKRRKPAAPPVAMAASVAETKAAVSETTESPAATDAPTGGAEATAEADGGPSRVAPLFDRRMLKWYAGGAALVLGSVGAVYIAIDGPRYAGCSKDAGCTSGRDRLPQRYDTLLPGVLMVTGAAVLAAGGVYLYLRERRNPGGAEARLCVVPTLAQSGGGAAAVLRW